MRGDVAFPEGEGGAVTFIEWVAWVLAVSLVSGLVGHWNHFAADVVFGAGLMMLARSDERQRCREKIARGEAV